mgnify:FL=1
MNSQPISISEAVDRFLEGVALARSQNTTRTYRNVMKFLETEVLPAHQLSPGSPITAFKEDAVTWLVSAMRDKAPTTERLHLTALSRFFEFLAAENLAPINLPRVHLLIRQRARRPGVRLPQFPQADIEKVLDYAEGLLLAPVEDESERLRNLRDRAFLITLADTGLRVHEACNLRRGDLNWQEGRAVIIGKGNREAVIRFTRRSQSALEDYLRARAQMDGASGRPLTALPLFARHDRGNQKRVCAITTATGRNIVKDRVLLAIGSHAKGSITPHSFRHYFVTRILQASGNLKLAQELARHRNIAVTQRYAHLSDNELDRGYYQIFETKKKPSDEE